MLSEKRIKSLVMDNVDLLEALEEFDRTGQLSKVSYKERVNFTVDMDVMRTFRSYCKKQNRKMSAVVEELIKEEIGK
jgi:hypothetical protein